MPAIHTKYSKTKVYDDPLFMNPQSTEEIFPVKSIDETGIFELNHNMYSKSFILTDINFAGVTDAEQKSIIINFSKVLNSMSNRFSYTVANEYVDQNEFNNRVLYKMRGDSFDVLRGSYNHVIKDKLTDAKQGLYQTIYFTLTISAESLIDARSVFGSFEASLRSIFIQIGVNGMAGSKLSPVGINERMQIWYNFTHSGLQTGYKFHYRKEFEARHDWTNIVSPSSMVFYNDYFVMNGNKYGRVMHISNYAKNLESETIAELSKINCTSYVTVNSEILDIDGLKLEIGRKHASVGMKIESEKQRNRNNNDFLSNASDKLLSAQESLNQFARQVDDADDHFFNSTIFVMVLADSKEDLEKNTMKIVKAAGVKSLDMESCFSMQRQGINSAFVFGAQEFKRVCNFSAPCLAMFMPFKTQELNEVDGTYYGVNQISQNAIFANRKRLNNYNGLIFGKSGSGKSMFCKSEIISTALNHPEDQIIIVDPQNEYYKLAPKLNASLISFDSQKEIYINPLDVDFQNVDYAMLQVIIAEKTDFILTLLSSCMHRDIDAEEQGILDAVIEKVYGENYATRKKLNGEGKEITEYTVPEYMRTRETILPTTSNLSNDEQIRQYSPTLQDVYQRLLDEDNVVAHKLAAHMQIFVNGSLNLFNHRTNVDLNRKILIFDVSNIMENIRTTSILVMLEIIRDKVKSNFAKGNWTDVRIDEFHELLGIDRVAKYIVKLWKELRKMNGILTGVTQNMTDLLQHSSNEQNLAAILSNTEYFALLSQSSIDKNELMRFLTSISPAMFNFVEEAEQGTGLLKMGSVTIPFDMRMSKECEVYKLINTDGNDTNMST